MISPTGESSRSNQYSVTGPERQRRYSIAHMSRHLGKQHERKINGKHKTKNYMFDEFENRV